MGVNDNQWIYNAAGATNDLTFGGCAPTNVPLTTTGGTVGTLGILSPVTGPLADPCIGGHIADPNEVESTDGLFITSCKICHARILLTESTKGISFLKVSELLGLVMALDEETCLLPEFDLGEMLAKFNALRDALHEEEFRLRQARKNLELAGRILQHKAHNTVE